MARPFRKQIMRLQTRQRGYDDLTAKLTPAQAASFKRPGSMNAHKGTNARKRHQ